MTKNKAFLSNISEFLKSYRKLCASNSLIKNDIKKRSQWIRANIDVARNKNGTFTEEEIKRAHENLKLIDAGYVPKHAIRDENVGPRGKSLEQEWAKLNEGRAGKKTKGAESEDFEGLREQRAEIRAKPQQTKLISGPRSAEEQQKAKIISTAKKQEKQQAALDNQPNIGHRASAMKEIIHGSNPGMTKRGVVPDKEIDAMKKKLQGISDPEEAELFKQKLISKQSEPTPEYHPIYKKYGINQKDWHDLDHMDKMLHMANHYELVGLSSPHSKTLKSIAPPTDIHEMLVQMGGHHINEDEAHKAWHSMGARDQRQTYDLLKQWRQNKTDSPPTIPQGPEIKAGQLKQEFEGQPNITQPVKKL